MTFDDLPTVSFEECLKMEAAKTGALLGYASSVGAVLSGANEDTCISLEVFGYELGIPEKKLFDKHDEICEHFLIFNGKDVVGSMRIRSIDQIIKLERMAILKDFRTKNYGKESILEIIEYYSTKGASKIILD